MTSREVRTRSRRIVGRLTHLPEYARSRCIMLYWSCHNEVHTHNLVRQALKDGKRVAFPRCDTRRKEIHPFEVRNLSGDLEVGAFGILQPREDSGGLVDLSQIDLCVVPGIAFDREGNRVGRGLGYYDRFLRKLGEKTRKIGVGFAFQILDKIYPTDGDTSLDMIVTEDETLVTDRR